MNAIWIILIVIAAFFLGHFICLPISKYIRKHLIKNHTNKIIKTKHFSLYATTDKSLMLIYHHHTLYDYDGDKRPYAKEIALYYGGFYISWSYGHHFLTSNAFNEDGKSKRYGASPIDSEWYWRTLWWGNKLYENPFLPTKYLATDIYDIKSNVVINKKLVNSFQYDNQDLFPYIKTLTDTIYINKNARVQQVHEIKFWLEEMFWGFPILSWIKKPYWFTKNRLYLSFDSDTGLGINQDDWKGGVYGSSILIKKDTKLYKLYQKLKKSSDKDLRKEFKEELNLLINEFMLQQRLY